MSLESANQTHPLIADGNNLPLQMYKFNHSNCNNILNCVTDYTDLEYNYLRLKFTNCMQWSLVF